MKKILTRLILVAAAAGAVWGGYLAYQQIPRGRETEMPTAVVRQGDVVVRSFARGELRAVRSVTLTAPNLFGTVQVTRISPVGGLAQEKDLIVQFDDAELQSRLEERQLDLEQVDEQIKKAKSDLAIRDNQDEVDLIRARYAVRRAELEVQRNELLSAIDAQKNELNLEEARRRLAQLENDIKSRRQQAEAELAVLSERRNRSMLDLNRERARLAETKLLAPMSGLVAIAESRPGFYTPGMDLPEIREGDQVQPGMAVAEILDLTEMEVVARVDELDRANLSIGQEVMITLDALADRKIRGNIKSMSATASADVFSGDPTKRFDVVFSVDMRELLQALGASEERIAQTLARAEVNRRNAPAATAAERFSGAFPGAGAIPGGGFPGGGGFAGRSGAAGGTAPPAAADGQGAGAVQAGSGANGGARERGNFTPEQAQQFRQAIQAEGGVNPQQMTEEQRAQLRARFQAGGAGSGPGLFGVGFGSRRFSDEDRAAAELPPPPEENGQLDILLRPGLLADVEILVENIPNAVYVPSQAVFQKGSQLIVYVQRENNQFEPREVKIAKRSDNVLIVESGVEPGDVLALRDPEASPQQQQAPNGGDGGGGPMGGFPGAKKG